MNNYWHSEHNGDARCGAMYDLLHPEPSVTHGVITPVHDKVTCPYCIAALPSGYGWSDEQKAIMAKEADRHQPPAAEAEMPDATPGEEPRVVAILDKLRHGSSVTPLDIKFLVRRLRETLEERQGSYLALMGVLGSDRIGTGSIIDAIQNLIDHNTHLRGKAVELQEQLDKPKPLPADYVPAGRTTMKVLLTDDASQVSGNEVHHHDLVIEVSPLGRPSVIHSAFCHTDDIRVVTKVHTAGDLSEYDIEWVAKAEQLALDGGYASVEHVKALIRCRDYWYHEHARKVDALHHERARHNDTKAQRADQARQINSLTHTLGERVNDAKVAENLAIELSARRMASDMHRALRIGGPAPSDVRQLWSMCLDWARAHPTWPELTHALGEVPSSANGMLRQIENVVRFRKEVTERLSLSKTDSLGNVVRRIKHLTDSDALTEQVRQQFAEVLRVDPASGWTGLVFEARQLKSGYELLNLSSLQQPRTYIPVAPVSVRDWVHLIEKVKPVHMTVEDVCVEVLRDRERVRSARPKPAPPAPPHRRRRKSTAIDRLDLRPQEDEYDETLEQYTNRIGHTVGVHRK